jgi:NAD(P)-dependent dehydrogenase (short-subunit alcohol dehydrogenase family)
MNRLTGKVAVITGGCSGIGRATVDRFVEEGARVVVADVQTDRFNELSSAHGKSVYCQRCDVTEERDIAAAMQSAVDTWGGLDIVFNNAGSGGSMASIDQISAEEWDRTQALLLRSVALGIRHASTHMKAHGGGAIVNTASIAGLFAGYSPIAYAAAKAGVMQLSKVAAAELARYSIRVNSICPGFITSNIFAATFGVGGEIAAQIHAAVRAASPFAQPVAKEGLPSEVAKVCLFLASDDAAFVTGEHIVVDGGLTIGPRHSWDPATASPIRSLIENVVQGNMPVSLAAPMKES